MADLGMTFAELRVVGGKNIIDHTDAEIDDVRTTVEARGMRVLSIASPVLKCTLPDAPPVAPHIQQDMFSSASGFDDQPRLARRAFEIAERTGARIVRVFSYWRTIDPDACFERVASALRELADEATEAKPDYRHRERARLQHRHGSRDGAIARGRRSSGAAGHLGSRQCVCHRRDAVPARLRAPPALANRARAREGLHGYRSRAHVGTARRDGRSTGAGSSRRSRATATAAPSASRPTGRGRTATSSRRVSSAQKSVVSWYVV